MMATIQIENLPDELYKRIQSLAAQKNFSISEAVIHLLSQAIQPIKRETVKEEEARSMAEVLAEIRSRSRINPIDFGLPDSTILIREDRHR